MLEEERIKAARERAVAREAKASALYTECTDAWMAEQALLHLEEVVEVGLDPVYKGSADSFMNDWAADLSWDEDASRQLRSILDDPRFEPVERHFRTQLGFDLRSCLKQMLDQTNEYYGLDSDGLC